MSEFFSSALGTVFYSILVFVAGAFIGRQLWDWVAPKLPWNKK
jgi:hypothetical protein